jgi:hypothetical protein
MKKLMMLALFCLIPLMATAGTVDVRCFSDQFGDLYLFTGGKLNKKAYAVKADTVACGGEVNGLVTFAQLADNSFFMWGFISGNYSTCVPFEMAAVFNSLVTSGSGNFDTFPRNGTPDGNLTFTTISCASVPLNSPLRKYIPPGITPGTPTE